MEERRKEARKEEAERRVKTLLSTEDGDALRTRTEDSWRGEHDAARLRARTVKTYEAELARMQQKLEQLRTSEDTTELREAGLEVVKTASKDVMYAMAVHAAAQDGADMKEAEGGERWLAVAASKGRWETVRALAAAGAAVDHTNNYGWTALDAAAQEGHVEAIKTLLEAGADVDHADNDGETALFAAAQEGHGGYEERVQRERVPPDQRERAEDQRAGLVDQDVHNRLQTLRSTCDERLHSWV